MSGGCIPAPVAIALIRPPPDSRWPACAVCSPHSRPRVAAVCGSCSGASEGSDSLVGFAGGGREKVRTACHSVRSLDDTLASKLSCSGAATPAGCAPLLHTWSSHNSYSSPLRQVDLSSLSSRDQRLALFINIYNVLVSSAHPCCGRHRSPAVGSSPVACMQGACMQGTCTARLSLPAAPLCAAGLTDLCSLPSARSCMRCWCLVRLRAHLAGALRCAGWRVALAEGCACPRQSWPNTTTGGVALAEGCTLWTTKLAGTTASYGRHARCIQCCLSSSLPHRLRWFDSVSYLIGGQRFSSNDIEHGVLRGNKPRCA